MRFDRLVLLRTTCSNVQAMTVASLPAVGETGSLGWGSFVAGALLLQVSDAEAWRLELPSTVCKRPHPRRSAVPRDRGSGTADACRGGLRIRRSRRGGGRGHRLLLEESGTPRGRA